MAKNHLQNGLGRPRRVLIIGASGELGGELALAYARTGALLSLWGRDIVRLERIAVMCVNAGAYNAKVCSRDLIDVDAVVETVALDDDEAPFDIAIFASGLGDIRAEGARVESAALVARLGIVNFVSPAAIAAELANRMAARGYGTIILIGSAASFHALPFAAAYAASKAGLAHFAQALRVNVAPYGVSVTLASPGFIDTAAARKVPGPKPLAISAATAASRIVRAADSRKAHLVTPWPFALLRSVDRVLPRRLRERFLRSLTPPGR